MAPLVPLLLLALSPFAISSTTHLLIDGKIPEAPTASPTPPIPPYPTSPSPLVSALFVVGDSTVDCGTNNYLGTFARADHPPYGRDFDTHKPTGRFCNGRIIVDYLALRLGLPFVPPFLGRSNAVSGMIQGVNYASAASGIIYSSGSDLGMHVPLSRQMEQVLDTFQHFSLALGREMATDLISKSMFYVSIGSNDFIHYYFANVSGVQSRYLPWEFVQLLTGTMKQYFKALLRDMIQNQVKTNLFNQLKEIWLCADLDTRISVLPNLYVAGVRKLVVMGLAPLGCAPRYLWQFHKTNGECVDKMNNLVILFNYGMKYVVEKINQEYPGANMTFCDAFEGSMDIFRKRGRYGFETTTDACCGYGKFNGWIMCLFPEMACSNASTHVWWDQFHPTDAVNKILADNIWNGMHSNMCYPRNMQDMVA